MLDMDSVEKKFGKVLRQERESRQLDITELSERLKIPLENLQGIEEGDLSKLPTEVYYNLFARSYSTFLGIDFSMTIDAIRSDIEQAEMEKAAQAKRASGVEDEYEVNPEAEKSPLRKVLGIAAILVLLLLAYVAIDMLFVKDSTAKNEQDTYLQDIDKNRLAEFAGFDWDKTSYLPPQKIKIRLIPKKESWGSVMTDGDTAIFRKLLPGRVYEASAKYRMVVSIGVPSAVDIELNGRLANLRDEVSRRISRVHINQTNLESFFNRTSQSPTARTQQSYSEINSPTAENVTNLETLDKHKLQRDTVTKENGGL